MAALGVGVGAIAARVEVILGATQAVGVIAIEVRAGSETSLLKVGVATNV